MKHISSYLDHQSNQYGAKVKRRPRQGKNLKRKTKKKKKNNKKEERQIFKVITFIIYLQINAGPAKSYVFDYHKDLINFESPKKKKNFVLQTCFKKNCFFFCAKNLSQFQLPVKGWLCIMHAFFVVQIPQ